MVGNETIVQQLILQAKGEVYVPTLISVYIFFLIVHPLLTWAFASKNANWGNYWITYSFFAIIYGIVIVFASMSPDTMSTIFSKIIP